MNHEEFGWGSGDGGLAVRCAVIGCGFFAQFHLHAWRQTEGVTLAAVCDRDAERAHAAARAFAVPAWYTDAAAMLEAERLDFVDVATTPPSHRPLVEAVARRGLPVICQKPLAFDLQDARAIVAACRAAGVPLMVHENFRWQRPMRALRERLDAGAIGRPFYGRISFRTATDIYANQPYLRHDARLVLADMGVHLLDLARFFFGEPQTLACQALRVDPAVRGEDTAIVLLGFEDAACLVEASYASNGGRELFPQTLVHLDGDAGALDLGPGYVLTHSARDGTVLERFEVPIARFPWSTPGFEAIQESVAAIERHWVECLRAGRVPETSGDNNLRTLELVEGAYRAAASGAVFRPGRDTL
jgi:predicted dehydrogenase